MNLNFKQYGEAGDDMVILHGLFGMLDNWHTLAGVFSQKYKVWTIDQRNHGKSPHSDEFNYDILAADLAEFFEQHQIEKAVVIGHSMGGKTAMQFAFNYPEKVSNLIVVDIAPKAYDPKHDTIIDTMKSLNLSALSRRQEAEDALERRGISENSTRQFLLKNLERTPEGKFKWKMNLESLEKNYSLIADALPQDMVFPGYVLFIRGNKSDYILDSEIPAIKRQFPKAEFITLPAGHWVHAEAPKEFAETVINWLANK